MFFVDLQDVYLHIPIVNHHHHFSHFVWQLKAYQVLPLLTKPILFHCHCKDFHAIIYLDDILVLTLSMLARKLKHFCALYWLILAYILIFPSLNSIPCSNFLTLGLCLGYSGCVCLYHLMNLLRSRSWLMVCYGGSLLQSVRLCPFWARPPFV